MLGTLCAEAPGDADIRTHHGLALQGLGRPDAALADFEQALALNPANALALLYRGDLLLALGRAGDARWRAMNSLIRIAPGYDEAWFRRGAALCGAGPARRGAGQLPPKPGPQSPAASARPSIAARRCSSWSAMTRLSRRSSRQAAGAGTSLCAGRRGRGDAGRLRPGTLAGHAAKADRGRAAGRGGGAAADLSAFLRRRRFAPGLQRGFCRRPAAAEAARRSGPASATAINPCASPICRRIFTSMPRRN